MIARNGYILDNWEMERVNSLGLGGRETGVRERERDSQYK